MFRTLLGKVVDFLFYKGVIFLMIGKGQKVVVLSSSRVAK